MKFKILKRTANNSFNYICLDSIKSNRSRHKQNLIDTIDDVDYFESVQVELENYVLLYEFDSIEEFKEQYPEEFV